MALMDMGERSPHCEATWNRSAKSVGADRPGHQLFQLYEPSGSPRIRADRTRQGLLVHTALAMTDQSVPLGIAAQKVWTREKVGSEKRGPLPRKRVPAYIFGRPGF